MTDYYVYFRNNKLDFHMKNINRSQIQQWVQGRCVKLYELVQVWNYEIYGKYSLFKFTTTYNNTIFFHKGHPLDTVWGLWKKGEYG